MLHGVLIVSLAVATIDRSFVVRCRTLLNAYAANMSELILRYRMSLGLLYHSLSYDLSNRGVC
jgi:hypothetical protein